MSKSIPAAFTALTVVFFLGLALTFVFRMDHRRAENLQYRESELRKVVNQLAVAYRDGVPPASPTTREIISEHLQEPRGPRVFAVYTYDDGLEYLWTYSPAYIRTGPRAKVSVPGVPAFSYNHLTEGQLSRQIRYSGDESWIVDAIYPLLLGSDFFTPLRDSLIALIAFALITLLTAGVNARRPIRSAYPDYAAQPQSRQAHTAVSAPVQRPKARSRVRSDLSEQFDTRENSQRLPPSGVTIKDGARENYDFESTKEPQTRPAPATPTLSQRVNEAVQKAAAEDENLVLAVVQFPETSQAHELQRVLPGDTQVTDLQDGRFAVLLPEHDISEALRRFERLQAARAAAHEIPTPAVGLSARNRRLVSGDRLINEARIALRRAEHEPKRLMAFSPDANRFRDYIARTR